MADSRDSDSGERNPMDEALSQVMGIYRHEMTQFEVEAWGAIIDAAPVEPFLAFLKQHVLAGSPFRPLPSDASRALELVVDPAGAYAKLERIVCEKGPYQDPEIADPVLVQAVLYMGGWAKFNADMPDPNEGFAVKAFKDRFTAAFNQAVSAVRIRGEKPERPLLSLCTQRTQQALLAHQPAARLAAPSNPAREREGDTPSRSSRFRQTPA